MQPKMGKLMIGIALVVLVLMTLVGCGKDTGTFAYASPLKSYTFDISNQYTQGDSEVVMGFNMTSFDSESGKQIRVIEEVAPGYTVDEAYLEEELTVVEEIHVERIEKLDMATFGAVYGALLEDHSLNQYMFYYKFNVGEDVVTVLFSQATPLTEVDEKQIKAMIATLRLTQ